MDLDGMAKRVQELHALRPTIETLARLAPRLEAALQKVETTLPKETPAPTDDFRATLESLNNQVAAFGDRLASAEGRLDALDKFQEEIEPHLADLGDVVTRLAGAAELLEWLQAARPALEEVTKLAEPVEETSGEATGKPDGTAKDESAADEANAPAGS